MDQKNELVFYVIENPQTQQTFTKKIWQKIRKQSSLSMSMDTIHHLKDT